MVANSFQSVVWTIDIRSNLLNCVFLIWEWFLSTKLSVYTHKCLGASIVIHQVMSFIHIPVNQLSWKVWILVKISVRLIVGLSLFFIYHWFKEQTDANSLINTGMLIEPHFWQQGNFSECVCALLIVWSSQTDFLS